MTARTVVRMGHPVQGRHGPANRIEYFRTSA